MLAVCLSQANENIAQRRSRIAARGNRRSSPPYFVEKGGVRPKQDMETRRCRFVSRAQKLWSLHDLFALMMYNVALQSHGAAAL